MRKPFVIFIIAIMLVFNHSMVSFAAGNFGVELTPSNEIIITGNAVNVTVTVRNPRGDVIYVNEMTTSDEKSFTFNTPLDPDSDLTGDYTVRLWSEKGVETHDIYFINSTAKEQSIANINTSATSQALKQALIDESRSLGLNEAKLLGIEERLFVHLPFMDEAHLHLVIEREYYIDKINKADSGETIVGILKDNADLFELSEKQQEDINALTNESKGQFGENLKAEAPFDTIQQIKDTLHTSIAIPLLRSVAWGGIPDVLDRYSSVFGESVGTEILRLSNEEKRVFYKKIADAPPSDATQVYTYVKALVDEIIAGRGSGGGNGGGGGGGGRSTSVTVPKSYIDENTIVSDLQPLQVFNDLDGFEWAVEAITELKEKNVVSGDGEGFFQPNNNVTREEFIKMLVTALDIQGDYSPMPFTDVAYDAWYAQYVSAALDKNIVNGISQTRFGIGEQISRQDMAVFIIRALQVKGIETQIDEDTPDFSDSDDISEYAVESVLMLRGMGIVSGSGDNRFEPLRSSTKAEAAKVIYNLIKL